ncbi:hypothetical protein TELCIR_01510 [Teladorsagia circumcincta]|uniref:NXF1/2/3/5-like leucine-rich repeat domain-containing protein n=1 Tax=Teladorsagia circumcincta TaxID=45464 RepID=A0A2G9V385_TELCI|nr:hypothetical protein TELCIR_01510 [Teladorsagia circumcincta]
MVVDSRYNHDTRSLDLSEFALDPKFKERDLHMMLNKNNVMLTVVDRIDERFGSITALSLQGNRLRFLDYAAVLTSVTKFLKVLDLSNNQDGAPVQPAAVHVQSLDDDEVTSEPPCRPGFYGNDALRVLVERFLVEYFKLYDGEDGAITRKSLVQAYDADNSSFTMTIANIKDMCHEGPMRYPDENRDESVEYLGRNMASAATLQLTIRARSQV